MFLLGSAKHDWFLFFRSVDAVKAFKTSGRKRKKQIFLHLFPLLLDRVTKTFFRSVAVHRRQFLSFSSAGKRCSMAKWHRSREVFLSKREEKWIFERLSSSCCYFLFANQNNKQNKTKNSGGSNLKTNSLLASSTALDLSFFVNIGQGGHTTVVLLLHRLFNHG